MLPPPCLTTHQALDESGVPLPNRLMLKEDQKSTIFEFSLVHHVFCQAQHSQQQATSGEPLLHSIRKHRPIQGKSKHNTIVDYNEAPNEIWLLANAQWPNNEDLHTISTEKLRRLLELGPIEIVKRIGNWHGITFNASDVTQWGRIWGTRHDCEGGSASMVDHL